MLKTDIFFLLKVRGICVIVKYFGLMWKMCLYIMLVEGCWLLGVVFSVKIEEAFAGWWDLRAFCPATEKEGILCLLPLWILHLFLHCLAFLSSWTHNVFRSFFRPIYGFPVITRGLKCQDLLFYKTTNKTNSLPKCTHSLYLCQWCCQLSSWFPEYWNLSFVITRVKGKWHQS